MRSRAFTLVELLAALAVTALVVGASGIILTSVTRTRGAINQRMESDAEARAALDAIALALTNVRRPRNQQQIVLDGIDDWFGDIPADRVRFFTISRRVIREGLSESDVREVEFFLSQPEDGSLPALLRRTDPTYNGEEDGGGVIERVAGNIIGLQITYFDGQQWRDEWLEKQHAWPTAIRVRLTVVVDADRHITRNIGRTISFPGFTIDQRETES